MASIESRSSEGQNFINRGIEKAKKYFAPAVFFAISFGTFSAHLGVSALSFIAGAYTLNQASKPSHS